MLIYVPSINKDHGSKFAIVESAQVICNVNPFLSLFPNNLVALRIFMHYFHVKELWYRAMTKSKHERVKQTTDQGVRFNQIDVVSNHN